jgi:hypothetical protein
VQDERLEIIRERELYENNGKLTQPCIIAVASNSARQHGQRPDDQCESPIVERHPDAQPWGIGCIDKTFIDLKVSGSNVDRDNFPMIFCFDLRSDARFIELPTPVDSFLPGCSDVDN